MPGDKILPSLTLGAAYAAYIARLTRGGMLEVLSQDYIRTARAKGLPERVVILKHALRAGIIPVVSFLGPALAGLLSGSFVVETVFQVPGLGRFFVQAAFNRDYTVILGTTTFLAGLIVVFNLLSDVLAAWLNPRLRFCAEGQGVSAETVAQFEQGTSLWQDAWRRLRRNRLAVAGAIILVVIAVACVLVVLAQPVRI